MISPKQHQPAHLALHPGTNDVFTYDQTNGSQKQKIDVSHVSRCGRIFFFSRVAHSTLAQSLQVVLKSVYSSPIIQ